jgi:hypothetical protein
MELVKKNINEIDLADLEGNLKQYTNTAVSSIPQPDLSEYLTTSNTLVVPSLLLLPWEDAGAYRDDNLLVPKKYVDTTVKNSKPNLSNYATKDEIPDLSNYLTISDVNGLVFSYNADGVRINDFSNSKHVVIPWDT